MKRLLILLLLVPMIAGCSSSATSDGGNEQSFVSGNGIATFIKESARESAPSISGPVLSGGTFSAAEGKVTVVNVWASWCSPCRAEAPSLEELSKRHPEVQFVGILTRDSLVSARSFVERFGITYPTIIDDAILLKFHGQLTPNAIPTTLIIDKKGKIAARISGEITFNGLNDLIAKVASE